MPEDYFSLQLAFARRYAETAGVSFDVAVACCTNLRRRLHLLSDAGAGRWAEFLAIARSAQSERSGDASLLSAALFLYESRPEIAAPRTFGCFSYDPPDALGVLRIHFMPAQGLTQSPLAAESQAARRDELRSLMTQVRHAEPATRSVRGISWLYNLQAYRRLFPPAYGASARRPDFTPTLTGSSTWGQVLDWRQAVKPQAREAMRAALEHLKPDAPWEAFTHRALVAESPIEDFHEWFG